MTILVDTVKHASGEAFGCDLDENFHRYAI